MIIENLITRQAKLEAELSAMKARLAVLEAHVASLKVQTSAGARTVSTAESKSAVTTPTTKSTAK